jgi:hypothetical protein
VLTRVLPNLALVVLGVVFAWGAGEVLVRFVIPTSTVRYHFDREVGYRLEPGGAFRWVGPDYDVRVTTNAAGFHDVEHARAKPAGTYRILVLGDSMVEALQVPLEAQFPRLLEAAVGRWARERVEVVNFGVSGNGPAQYHRLLEQEAFAYEPDLVIVAVTLMNDFRNDVAALERDPSKPYYRLAGDELVYVPPADSPASRGRQEKIRPAVWLKTMVKDSTFARSFIDRIQKFRASHHVTAWGGDGKPATLPVTSDWNVFLADPPRPWDEAYAVTLRLLAESARLTRSRGARFLLVLVPPKAVVEDNLDAALRAEGYPEASHFTWDVERPTRAIDAMARAHDIPVLDLGPALRADWAASHVSCSWAHDGHWSPRGHALAAREIDAYLRASAAAFGLDARTD